MQTTGRVMRTRSPGSQRRAVNAVREHPDPGAAARLADLAWPDVAERAQAGALLAVPLGSTEQHGPHPPLSTDTDIAVAWGERLAAARGDVLIAPPVTYGSSGEHADFPGTLSIGQAALESLIVELGRSAARTFTRLLLVSAHGGNAGPVTRAAGRLRAESRDVHVYMPRWEGDPHAGRPETSMMLALAPARVRMHLAVPGDMRPLAQIWPLLRAEGVRAVNAAGILGDPTGAGRREGSALLGTLAEQLFREVDAWHPVAPAARARPGRGGVAWAPGRRGGSVPRPCSPWPQRAGRSSRSAGPLTIPPCPTRWRRLPTWPVWSARLTGGVARRIGCVLSWPMCATWPRSSPRWPRLRHAGAVWMPRSPAPG